MRRPPTRPPCVGTGAPTSRPSETIARLAETRPCGYVEGQRERRTVRPGTAADKGGEGAYRRGTCREEWSIRDHHKGCGTRGAGSTRGHRCQACEAAETHVRRGVGTPEEADVAWSGEVAALLRARWTISGGLGCRAYLPWLVP